ncbi:hypothetical protein DSO57_1023528 [Entomophthora muscae]|uniref:Uncharacterized protein n=1 Tax=Entomophthora muscae TaxID=34485 RepID=A0ACC2UPI3_9FUNG|nr:hypothetical protein DSO57_1023528 [Entomophthora muscae]
MSSEYVSRGLIKSVWDVCRRAAGRNTLDGESLIASYRFPPTNPFLMCHIFHLPKHKPVSLDGTFLRMQRCSFHRASTFFSQIPLPEIYNEPYPLPEPASEKLRNEQLKYPTWADQPTLFKCWINSLRAWDSVTRQEFATPLERDRRIKYLMNEAWDWFRLLDYTVKLRMERNFSWTAYEFSKCLNTIDPTAFQRIALKTFYLLKKESCEDSAIRMQYLVHDYLLFLIPESDAMNGFEIANKYFSALSKKLLDLGLADRALDNLEVAVRWHNKGGQLGNKSNMSCFNGFLINYLMRAWAQLDLVEYSELTFNQMQERTLLSSYNILLLEYGRLRHFEKIKFWWFKLLKDGYRPDIYSLSALLFGLGNVGRSDLCRKLFTKWFFKKRGYKLKPNLVIYTVMIKAFALSKDSESALEYFERALTDPSVQATAARPDTRMFAALLEAYAPGKTPLRQLERHHIESTMELFRYLLQQSLVDSRILQHIIKVYGCQGKLEEANDLLSHPYTGKSDLDQHHLNAEFIKWFGSHLTDVELQDFIPAFNAIPRDAVKISRNFQRQLLRVVLQRSLREINYLNGEQRLLKLDKFCKEMLLNSKDSNLLVSRDQRSLTLDPYAAKIISETYVRTGFHEASLSWFLERISLSPSPPRCFLDSLHQRWPTLGRSLEIKQEPKPHSNHALFKAEVEMKIAIQDNDHIACYSIYKRLNADSPPSLFILQAALDALRAGRHTLMESPHLPLPDPFHSLDTLECHMKEVQRKMWLYHQTKASLDRPACQ